MDSVFELARDFSTTFQPQIEPFAKSFTYLIAQDDTLLLVMEESDQLLGYLLGFDHHSLFANGRISRVEEITVRKGQPRDGCRCNEAALERRRYC